jgi:hypothetical protein
MQGSQSSLSGKIGRLSVRIALATGHQADFFGSKPDLGADGKHVRYGQKRTLSRA